MKRQGMRLTVRTLGPGTAYQEIIGLNVAVDEVLLVNGLYAGDLCERMNRVKIASGAD